MVTAFLWFLSMIASTAVSIIFTEPIRYFFTRLLSRCTSFGGSISGVYDAEFMCKIENAPDTYKEVIQLSHRWGFVFGINIPDQNNYHALAKIAHRKPIRVIGRIKHNRFFTGYWYHPDRDHQFHGSFQLLIDTSLQFMDGMWLGFSNSKNSEVTVGKWVWSKRCNSPYSSVLP